MDFVGVFYISVFVPVLIHHVYTFFVKLRPNLFPAQGYVFIFVGVDLIQYFLDIFALFVRFGPVIEFFYAFSLFFVGLGPKIERKTNYVSRRFLFVDL